MILVFLTLLIALSIVFILSGSCFRFSLKNFFDALSGIWTNRATTSFSIFKTGLQRIKSFFDIFSSFYPDFKTGLSNYLIRKVLYHKFTLLGSGS